MATVDDFSSVATRHPYSRSTLRVERVEGGWVKRAEPVAKNRWRTVIRCTTTLIPWPLLRSTATSGDCDSVQEEAARLRRWRAAGLPVPELLEARREHFVTA